MAKMRYSVGDKVDVSRAENGEDHERAVVIDSYELIIGEERKPMVVIEFEDGERKYMTATTPNVLPVYEEDERTRPEAEDEAEAVDEPDAELPADDEAHASGNGEVFFVDETRAPRRNGAGGVKPSRSVRLAWPPCTRSEPCASRAASPRCSRAA